MSEVNLQELYQSILLQHSKSPSHYGQIQSYTHFSEGYNPLCGDAITIYLLLKEGKIEQASFKSAACSICNASASILLEAVAGASDDTFDAMQDAFSQVIEGSDKVQNDMLSKDMLAFDGIKQFPTRKNCALLPWETLKKALNSKIKD